MLINAFQLRVHARQELILIFLLTIAVSAQRGKKTATREQMIAMEITAGIRFVNACDIRFYSLQASRAGAGPRHLSVQ